MSSLGSNSHPFLVELYSPSNLHYLDDAARHDHIICIPQSCSLSREVSPDDLELHILQSINSEDDGEPAIKLSKPKYKTLNGRYVQISGTHLVTCDGFREARNTRILVSDQILWKHEGGEKKIALLHLSRPLEGGLSLPDSMDEMDIPTIRRYTAILRSYPENELAFNKLDQYIHRVKSSISNDEEKSSAVSYLEEELPQMWSDCVDSLLHAGLNGPDGSSQSSNNYVGRVEQVVESYLTESLFECLIGIIRRREKDRAEAFERVLDQMKLYTLSDFEVSAHFQCGQDEALEALSNLRECKTPLDMLLCFKKCIHELNLAVERNLRLHQCADTASAHEVARYRTQLTTDDMLDILLYILVSFRNKYSCLNTQGWSIIHCISFISSFHFVNSHSTILGFAFANFQVAVEWFMLRIHQNPSHSIASVSLQDDMGMIEASSRCILSSIQHSKYQRETRVSYESHQLEEITPVASTCNQFKVYSMGKGMGAEGKFLSMSTFAESDGISSSRVVSLNGGGNRIFAQLTTGEVFQYGAKPQREKDTEKDRDMSSVVDLEKLVFSHPKNIQVVQISCGSYHTLVCDFNGHVYGWGIPHVGVEFQRDDGGETLISTAKEPQLVEDLRGIYIASVACGDYHSLALTSTGMVYSWGSNSHGNLGRDGPTNKPGMIQKKWNSYTLSGERRLDKSVQLNMEYDSKNGKSGFTQDVEDGAVLRISCGRLHSFAITRDGAAFAWGCGASGRLGVGSEMDVRYPSQVMALSDPSIEIVQVGAGDEHSVFLLRSGLVFVAGGNTCGQLGRRRYFHKTRDAQGPSSDKQDEPPELRHSVIPIPLPESLFDRQFILLSVSANHSAAMDHLKNVFVWGSNLDNQCSSESIPVQFEPRIVRDVPMDSIHHIACSNSNTFFC